MALIRRSNEKIIPQPCQLRNVRSPAIPRPLAREQVRAVSADADIRRLARRLGSKPISGRRMSAGNLRRIESRLRRGATVSDASGLLALLRNSTVMKIIPCRRFSRSWTLNSPARRSRAGSRPAVAVFDGGAVVTCWRPRPRHRSPEIIKHVAMKADPLARRERMIQRIVSEADAAVARVEFRHQPRAPAGLWHIVSVK